MKKGSSARHKNDKQGRSNRKTCYNRGHNYEDTHYIFLHQSGESSDQEDGISLQRLKEEYLEKELEPGDTLQTLAIQFNCPVAELKRINHIHRENEVFARRKIKVPVKYYSLLSEKLVGVHKTPCTSKEGSTRSSLDDPSEFLQRDDMSSSLSLAVSNSPPRDDLDCSFSDNTLHDKIFPPLNGCTLSTEVLRDNENAPLIAEDSESRPTLRNNEVFQCSGSDWGLSWPQLLLCTLLLGFAGPIVYIFYLKEALDEKNGSHISNSTSA